MHGLAASPGVAFGRIRLLDPPGDDDAPHRGAAVEAAAALSALDGVAAELVARTRRLRDDGFAAEAEILEANHLMALDPALRGDIERLAAELTAPAALVAAAELRAAPLAALSDPLLAARATDVQELGRRAARALRGSPVPEDSTEPSILVAVDLGPADVAELREEEFPVVAIALAAGAATSHAAIMARSLGLPMVVAAGESLLADAASIVVDGNDGAVYLDPMPEREAWAAAEMTHQAERRRGFARARALPPVTRDGQWVTLLANAATTTEIRAALDAEADGVGLLRTELAFLDAQAWPTQEEHERALAPLLALLPQRAATVRVLDFGEDKTPPFLRGTAARGLTLLLEHPEHLAAQLRAILRCAADTNLRILLPLVETAEQVRAVRALLGPGPQPPLGAMIETPGAAEHAYEIALEADFLSIGTNDLVQYTLGYDRSQPLATTASAADPRVLRLIAATAAAAREAGLTVEICGESASLPELAALYVGLGIDELSVAPSRLDEVRATIRHIRADRAAVAAEHALSADSAEHARALGSELVSGELGNEEREVLGGRGGVLA